MLSLSSSSLGLAVLLLAGADPHVHGQGNLSISSDGSTLVAEFTTDQHTLFGFEGGHMTDTQRARKETVTAALTAPGALFRVGTSVTCEVSTTGVEEVSAHDNGGLGHHDEGHHDDGHHDDHDHDHDHDEHDHAEHHDDHEDHDDHRDVTIRSVFNCSGQPAIESVDVTAFDQLSDLETVNVIVLTDDQQAEEKTDRNQRTARF